MVNDLKAIGSAFLKSDNTICYTWWNDGTVTATKTTQRYDDDGYVWFLINDVHAHFTVWMPSLFTDFVKTKFHPEYEGGAE